MECSGADQFEILENPNVPKKLGQQELEIAAKLQTLKLNLVKVEKKRKSVAWYSHGHFPTSTKQNIEWKVMELSELKQSLYELSNPKKPGQRQNCHLCSSEENSFNEELVKLHKAILHRSTSLVQERQLLQQIKQVRGEKEKISCDNCPPKPARGIFTYLHQYERVMNTSRGYINPYTKEAVTDCVKALSKDIEELRMKEMGYKAYNLRLDLEKTAIEKDIRISERRLENMKQKKVELASKSQAI